MGTPLLDIGRGSLSSVCWRTAASITETTESDLRERLRSSCLTGVLSCSRPSSSMLALGDSASIFASSIICLRFISKFASSCDRRLFIDLIKQVIAVSDRSLLLRNERGKTLTAGSDVVQNVLDAAPRVHGQSAYLVVEIPSVGVKILNVLKYWDVKTNFFSR